jgi:hypothetical protein
MSVMTAGPSTIALSAASDPALFPANFRPLHQPLPQ